MLKRTTPAILLLASLFCFFIAPFFYENNHSRIIIKKTTNNYFGLHIHHADKGSPWPEFKFSSWRLWDAYVGWPDLEPERGKWDFERLDRYVNLAEKHNVEILLPLGRTPRWASSRPDEKSAYGLGQAAEPKAIEDWLNYVRIVTQRYKGRIRHFEIWNEPNLNQFFTGSQATLLKLQKDAYKIIKSIDNKNIVVMPAATSEEKWLDSYLALGAAHYADIIGYHFYIPKHAPEQILHDIRLIQELIKKHNINKPIWNTESGWRISNTHDSNETINGVPSDWPKLSPDVAAGYVSRALILGREAGLERYYWYAWDNKGMGLIEPSNNSYKPSAYAYAKTLSWMTNKTFLGCKANVKTWTCQLADETNKRFWLVWRTKPSAANWHPPSNWNVKRYETLRGEKFDIPISGLRLDGSPIMFF